MEIMDERTHQVLAYIAAVQLGGESVTVAQLESYASAPGPKPALYQDWRTQRLLDGAASWEDMTGRVKLREPERWATYLTRVGWVTLESGKLRMTPLGRSVLTWMNTEPVEMEDRGPATVEIIPDDQLAYLKIFATLGTYGNGYLIDPYLDFNSLRDVREMSQVTRILTSKNNQNQRMVFLKNTLEIIDEGIEVRTINGAKLHDRVFFSDDATYMLGSSLNSIAKRPGVLTPIHGDTAVAGLRAAYEELWREAEVLEPAQKK